MNNSSAPFVDRRKHKLFRRCYSMLFAGMIDMSFAKVRQHVILVMVLIFEVATIFVWISEILDLPVYIGARPTDFSWQRPALFTVIVFLLLYLSYGVVRALFKQIRYLEGFLPVCSFCKSIRINGKWLPLERYLQEHTAVKMTHSLCPPCAKQHYGYDEAEEEGAKGE
jgi:hypothetical protein